MALINVARLRRFWENVQQRLEGMASADLSDVSGVDFAKKAVQSSADGIYTAESDDGVAYTVTIPGITELKNGMRIMISPARNSASTSPTLDVNGLGTKNIRLPLSFNTIASATPRLTTFYTAGKPILLMYDEDYGHGTWKAVEKPRVSAQDLYGVTPIESGGTGANNAADALANLGAASTAYVDAQVAALTARIEALENR